MRLTFLGGADEVGASSTLIEIAGKRLLIDAGIRISPRTSRGIQNSQLPDLRPISEIGGPDYILVTHAHTDHTGALPLVVEQYPHVPVIASGPTVELVRVLQADAQRIMQSRHEQEGELPLFDELAVQRLLDAFQPVDFKQAVRLGEGLQVTYHPAGHIVGAAILVIESAEGTLVMSGDLSMTDQRAVVSAKIPRIKADALVLESTYGGKLHANRVAEERRLIETLLRIIERDGRVLIPAFAIGRAQEVLQILLAYRDQIDVPVYVDGMVRAVCSAYSRFSDWLPAKTTKAAGEDALFFRKKIKAIKSAVQREEVARATGPAIIVASSGMLTGGASVVYARHMAGDERNAILLTGYQDEEAPGRFLQRLKRDREAGKEATLKIDGKPVKVRCEVDTYSLSAHADEAELVSMAEVLKVDDVMLVHGDPQARHSLAAALRQRDKRARLPKIGQTHEFTFAKRPWAIGGMPTGSQKTQPLDPVALWEALKAQAGNFYSSRELARIWWGDESRAAEAQTVLEGEGTHFAQDWRKGDTFRVRALEQVNRSKRQRAIMQGCPDLFGQLVVLRDSNQRPRVGVVVAASIDAFEAVVRNAKGRHYPADALLWPLGRYAGPPEEKGMPGRINHLFRAAKAVQDALLPFAKRQQLVENDQPVTPESLLPETLPDNLTQQTALLAIVLGLAEDGAKLDLGTEANTGWRLVPKRALREGPLEMNMAREVALNAFPPEARLRKVGMETQRHRMTLTFDFPDRAAETYAEQIAQLDSQTGWDVVVNPRVNQQALGEVLYEMLPPGGQIVKGPSFHLDQGRVEAQLNGVEDEGALADTYEQLTGFHLATKKPGKSTTEMAVQAQTAPTDDHAKMEINAAYSVIRDALEPYGLYKTSLKQGGIMLTFISPQVGLRHQALIETLAQKTGYTITVHPHPNQQMIIQVARQLAREAGWAVQKGPSMHTDRGEVGIKLSEQPPAEEIAQVGQTLETETGYKLVAEY